MPRTRLALLTATGMLACAGLTGCSLFGDDGSQQAAERLADALGTGNLEGLTFSGGTPRQAQQLWEESVAGMGDARPTVEVVEVEEGEGDGPVTARLSYSWDLAAGEPAWTYRSSARLTPDTDADNADDAEQGAGDEWLVALAPTLVHPDLREGERLTRERTFAARGDITGAGGATLVTERPVQRFGIDKTQVAPARQAGSARQLAELLGIDARAYVEQVRKAGDEAFVEALVLRPAQAREKARAGDIPGVGIVSDTLPLAPTREFARPILGVVGPVSAEVVEQSDGVYGPGDEAGLSGLQARYDEQLRGTPGVTVRAVAEEGEGRELYTVEPQPGEPLATTLAPRTQRLAEQSLADVGPASALVAIRPSTGALVAVASGPGSEGYSTATVGRYAPGSTFKVVTSLALLRAGLRPDSVLDCPPTTVVNGKSFKNYDDYPASGLGRISLRTAVANSCNTAFINERDTVSQADLAEAAASLGLGEDHDLGFPAFFGAVPAKQSSQTDHAASMIGQGRVVASPMAMAAVAASVARGEVVVPRLLPERETTAAKAAPLTQPEADALRTLMGGVVTGGSAQFLSDVPGPQVIAKTGTAEFGTEVPLQTHVWMIAARGDLAVAVFVDVGDSGSQTAGPVLEEFLRSVSRS